MSEVCETCRPLLDAITAERETWERRAIANAEEGVRYLNRAEKAEAEVAALREQIDRVKALADKWDHREYVRLPEDFAADLRAALGVTE